MRYEAHFKGKPVAFIPSPSGLVVSIDQLTEALATISRSKRLHPIIETSASFVFRRFGPDPVESVVEGEATVPASAVLILLRALSLARASRLPISGLLYHLPSFERWFLMHYERAEADLRCLRPQPYPPDNRKLRHDHKP